MKDYQFPRIYRFIYGSIPIYAVLYIVGRDQFASLFFVQQIAPLTAFFDISGQLSCFLILFLVPGFLMSKILFKREKTRFFLTISLSFGLSTSSLMILGVSLKIIFEYVNWDLLMVLMAALSLVELLFLIFSKNANSLAPRRPILSMIGEIAGECASFWDSSNGHRRVLVILIVLLGVSLAGVLGYLTISVPRYAQYSEFFVLSPDGTAGLTERNLFVGEDLVLILCTRNNHESTVEYIMEFEFDESITDLHRFSLKSSEESKINFTRSFDVPGISEIKFRLRESRPFSQVYEISIGVSVSSALR